MTEQTQKEVEAIQDFAKFLIDLAVEEGRKFEQEHGRKPTEAEAGVIADMIQRQLKTALVLSKGNSQ